MKILIVYSSRTGNTQKLAETVYGWLAGEKTLCAVEEAPDPAGFDLVVLGFHLMGGKPDPKSADYLSKIGRTKLFLVATHGAAAESAHAANAMAYARSQAPDAQILGTFNCPGQVEAQFLQLACKKEPPPPWIADADAAIGHPDADDVKKLEAVIAAQLGDYLPR